MSDPWIYAIMAAGAGAQAIGTYLAGSSEGRKQFRTKDNVAMGDALAEFTGSAIQGMLTDARTRGFASTAPRVKFEIPTGRTKTGPGVLPWSGQNYQFGGSRLGTFSETQGQYAGLGGGQARTELSSLESYYMKKEDDNGIPQDPVTKTGDDGIRVTTSEQWPHGRGRGRADDSDDWTGNQTTTTLHGSPVPGGRQAAVGGGQPAPEASSGGGPPPPPQHQGSGGQYGQRYEEVKALRDNVASRGNLARNGGGRGV